LTDAAVTTRQIDQRVVAFRRAEMKNVPKKNAMHSLIDRMNKLEIV